MDRHAAVIGGSVAGLAAGIALARRGWLVTVVERDAAPDTDDGDEAFVAWDRRNVPQFRQPHAFSARSRNLLLAHIPEVVDWMLADGIEEINLFKMLAPPELWSDGDDAYTGLWSRRPAFELAMRRVAEAEPGLTILAPGVVAGLMTATERPREPLRVTGLRLGDGSELGADLVLDAGGRRTPVPKWLAERGIEVPTDIQDCGSVYCSRYYRLNPDAGLPLFAVLGVREQVDRLSILGFPGDHDTYGLAVFVCNDDDGFKAVRHTWAWDPLMAAFPRVAPWADPANGMPLTDVQFMGGHQNVRRHLVVDGRPLVHNLLPVGDALCTTNPIYGWGASMALTYTFAAVESAEAHAGDPEAMALAFDEAVRDEADGVYRESAAMDRARGYRWRGEEVPAWDREEVERQELIACVLAGATRDPVLGRATLRRMNLLESPAAVLDDPAVVERARHTQAMLAAKAARSPGPTRGELLDMFASSAPAGG
jgi:2-polyprenyl-6-methoxyphenol hydroxylase-like FAD-dependent oxidoreductase